MQYKFWTPELWCEFLEGYSISSGMDILKAAEQFKSSKSPKKEWEIVAFGERFDGRILQYKLQPSGLYRNEGDDCDIEYEAGQFVHDYEFIHSVRRLSDGEVFSVGEKSDTPFNGRHIIDGFEIEHGDMLVKLGGGYLSFSAIQKLPQPILTTVDGVEIAVGQEFWPVGIDKLEISPFSPHIANETDRGKWKGAILFSTKQKAEEHILNNRPLLSLIDVKEALFKQLGDTPSARYLLEPLTALVKQKLNQ